MSREITVTLQLDVDVDYTVTSWGAPEEGPSYASGGQPAEPPEFIINSIVIGGKEVDWETLPKESQETIDDCIYQELWEDGRD